MMQDKRGDGVVILGINSAYHEPSAVLLRDGQVVAAVEEERFNRIRHGKVADLENPHWLPLNSIQCCLQVAGIRPRDISAVGFSFDPDRRIAFNVGLNEDVEADAAGTGAGEKRFHDLLLTVPAALSEVLQEDLSPRFHWLQHHLCHAASAFYASPFTEAAILSVDGIGETASIWMGTGRGARIEALREIDYPNSLGFLWTKASRFLGFGEYGQWKVMGLAGYGDATRAYSAFRRFVSYDDDGHFSVDGRLLQFRTAKMDRFEELFGRHREAGCEIEEHHKDFAAALQRVTNEATLSLARYLHGVTGSRFLCQAGGVALNCIANRTVLEEGPFDSTFVQPAANDAGTALGACYYLWHDVMGQERTSPLTTVYLGPEYDLATFDGVLPEGTRSRAVGDGLEATIATLLAAGEIVAWFQGRMEFGPRALGNRSFLADPRRPEIVHALNEHVKHREYFRPFAASVLDEDAPKWFEIPRESASDAYMLHARRVRADKLGLVPAVTHVDGTCRIQRVTRSENPRFHDLIGAFARVSGVPLVLNTSLNESEPIVCTPEDAVNTCRRAGIRFLAIEGELFELPRETQPALASRDKKGSAALVGPELEERPVKLVFRSR